MIDANLIKNNSQIVIENLKSRNYDLDYELYESLESDRKKYQTEAEDLKSQRKILSQEFGILKKEGNDDSKLSKKIDLGNSLFNSKIFFINSEYFFCSKRFINSSLVLRIGSFIII